MLNNFKGSKKDAIWALLLSSGGPSGSCSASRSSSDPQAHAQRLNRFHRIVLGRLSQLLWLVGHLRWSPADDWADCDRTAQQIPHEQDAAQKSHLQRESRSLWTLQNWASRASFSRKTAQNTSNQEGHDQVSRSGKTDFLWNLIKLIKVQKPVRRPTSRVQRRMTSFFSKDKLKSVWSKILSFALQFFRRPNLSSDFYSLNLTKTVFTFSC